MKKLVFVCLLLAFACPGFAQRRGTEALGQYKVAIANAPVRTTDADYSHMNAVYNFPDVDIIAIAMPWTDVDTTPSTYPTKGTYTLDFSAYDGYANTVLQHGKEIAFIVQGASYNLNSFTPAYVYSQAQASANGQSTPLDQCTCANYAGGTTASIISITPNGSVATVALGNDLAHIAVNMKVTIAGASPAGYNGNFAITAFSDARHFTISTRSGLSNGQGGTVVPLQCNRPLQTGSHKELPIVWEPVYRESFKRFYRYVANHFSINCNASLPGGCAPSAVRQAVAYLRLGGTTGGETNWSCYSGNNNSTADPAILPAPNTFSFANYQNYLTSLATAMHNINNPSFDQEISYSVLNGDDNFSAAEIVIAALQSNGIGTGVQSLQASDIANYPANPCAANWCAEFNQYAMSHLHLQPFACTSPYGPGAAHTCTPGDPDGLTGDLPSLASFIKGRMSAPINILELWFADVALAAKDPKYCVNPVGDTCAPGSVQNAHGTYLQNGYPTAYANALHAFRQ